MFNIIDRKILTEAGYINVVFVGQIKNRLKLFRAQIGQSFKNYKA